MKNKANAILMLLVLLAGTAEAAPTFQAAGASGGGNNAVTPTWPTHAVGDVALLFVESAGGEAATLSTPAGFAAVPNSPQATGTTTNGTRITVFWARATSAAMGNPTVADTGNHVYAQILTYRGVVNTGNPWNVTGGGVKGTATTSVSVTGVTTTEADTLVVQAVARDNDSNAAEFSAVTNPGLTGIVERTDAGTTSSNGGGFAVWDGVRATAGATGNTTATLANSAVNAFLTIALRPMPPSVVSIARASANPTATATAVAWTVTFNLSVTGVDTSDFSLVETGGALGSSITSVTGSGTTWTVNADTGTGGGTLGLDLLDDDSIIAAGQALGGSGAGNGDFTGETYSIFACTAPPNIPAGVSVSCVCDTFGRASLNPSTIFGGNWALSNSDGISNPYINATTGLLRLTENTNNNAKAATVPSIFPAAGNFISVEFTHYAYRGGNPGADGIAVTLSDYSVPAVPGGFGGSLGYAQRNDGSNPPGFAGGWVGIALDEFGNYQNPTEGRVGGGGFIVQSVGVRGPGSGANGYRWMGGTASNPGGFSISANSASATPAPGYMYQVVVDARNYASGTVNVSVNRDATTRDGSSYGSLFGPFNAYTEANYALGQGWISQLVPDYWKISFTGSTGGSINVHEIGSLRICAQTVYPPTGGTASGFSAIDEAYPGAPTVPAYPNFQTGNIFMKLTGTPFRFWVAALTTTAISTGYSATSNKYVQVKLVDNSDNACGPDSARTCNATCTNKTAVEAGATQTATFASGSTTGVASPSPTFTLNSAYKNLIAVMKECTTSACTAFTATSPACSADSFSVRPLSIASVASIDTPTGTGNAATNAGTSGVPRFKAASDSFALTGITTGIAGYPSKYTGVMKINNAALQANSPATVPGVVAGTFPAATSATPASTATGTAFTYSEVGGFALPGYNPATDTTSLRGVYDGVDTTNECTVPGLTAPQCDVLRAASWTGTDSVSTKGDCVADSYSNSRNAAGKYGCSFGLLPNPSAPNRWVFGRFIPDHFDTAVTQVAGVPMPCPDAACPILYNGFVYSGSAAGQPGQPFTLNVYARNGAGAITRNYETATGLSKAVTLSAWDALGGNIANANGTLNDNAVATTAFASGSTVLGTPATPNFTFTATPTAPTNIYLRAEDTDSVTSLRGASSVEGGVKVVSGRVRVSNVYGAERLPLQLTAIVQYWGGANLGYVTSATDNINTITPARITRSNCSGSLLSGGVCSATLGAISSVATVPATPPPYGSYTIQLSAPGTGNAGSEYLTINAGGWPAWLPSNAGRATFGIYRGANEFIYMREAY